MRIKHLGRKLLSLVLSASLAIPLSLPALAGGDPNADHGGNENLQDEEWDGWGVDYNHPEGVRVTIVDADSGEPKSKSIDLTNLNPTVTKHYNYQNKYNYKQGYSLSSSLSTYRKITPTDYGCSELPIIVGGSLSEIKSYFTNFSILKRIATKLGFSCVEYDASKYNTDSTYRANFENEKNVMYGDYKFMIEPVVYLHHHNTYYALTATEAALLDKQQSGTLKTNIGNVTHYNVPNALYLAEDMCGYYAGYKTLPSGNRYTNEQIIANLGISFVSFYDDTTPPPTNSTKLEVSHHLYTAKRRPKDGYTVSQLKKMSITDQIKYSDEIGTGVWSGGTPTIITPQYPTSYCPRQDSTYKYNTSDYLLIGMERVKETNITSAQYPSSWTGGITVDGASIWPNQYQDIIPSGGITPTTIVDIYGMNKGNNVYDTIVSGYEIHTATYTISWVENYSSLVYAHTYTSTRQLPVGVTKSTALHKRRKKS